MPQMKEKGIKPVRPWQERPIYVSSTTSTFEPYVPPEGDGKVSTLSAAVSYLHSLVSSVEITSYFGIF